MTATDPSDRDDDSTPEPDEEGSGLTLGRLSEALRDEDDPDHDAAVKATAAIREQIGPAFNAAFAPTFKALEKLRDWPTGYGNLARGLTTVDVSDLTRSAALMAAPAGAAMRSAEAAEQMVENLVELVNIERQAKDDAKATNHRMLVAAWTAAGLTMLGVLVAIIIAIVTA